MSESTPGPSSFTRRRSEDEDSSRISKKPRTRVSYSCGECHRRKQKCDRQIPCSHCVARKVPELCKAYTPGKTDQDIHVRLARLEHIIETALPHYWSQGISTPCSDFHGRRRSTSPGAEDGNRSQAEEEDPSGGMIESGRWYGKSASESIAAPALLEQLQNLGSDGSPAGGSGQASLDGIRSDARILPNCPEPTAADKLKRLILDCGVPPHKISELLSELPPIALTDRLVNHYFSAINWTRYPISERDFRMSYASICAGGTTINPNNIRFLPLLFVILAISVRLAPDHIGGDERTRMMTSVRYYWSSRRSLLVAAAIQPDCFEMVLTRMLSARFLILDRRMTESWSQLGAAVRTAQALGLHRDGAPMGMDAQQVEKRRRIWAHLYHADRSIALVLGRPIAIQDAYTSTLPPSNVEDLETSDLRSPLPLTTPTPATFMILRNTLASIMGRMSHHFQKVRSAGHYSDVVTLDDELLKFMQSLPSHYAIDPDTSLDQSHPYIPVHRFLLVTEILFVRMTLHRPYLLRRLGSDRYLRSRTACFESALKDYHIRRVFLETTTKEARDPVVTAYREFQSAMISGIYIVLHPNGSDVAAMHSVLDGFIKSHGDAEDETTRRELAIILFLKKKSSQMTGNLEDTKDNVMVVDNPPSQKPPQMDAHLLLSLRKPTPPRSMSGPPISNHLSNASFAPGPSLSGTAPSSASPATNVSNPHLSPVQQLQHSESQSGTGSPNADDESAAQNILDQWCDIFSGGPTLDESTGAAPMPWGTPGLADLSGWMDAPVQPQTGIEPIPGVADSDWNYWETLVNQIRSSPMIHRSN
ncbi:hypothetical protein CERSUDRAFT_80391 [Gelatoporia subvermispora B]|uniref:Zn(2)-C6 fungal-type domain-containing protein n=1 Tax=Ceriporiopsis subvermispora (strain B) TaxID=914234 RepID=M2RQL1_CERS8|nr:hypothetical protein CERSUDRAFT_80391 [Gelatoporia subvermispora B]